MINYLRLVKQTMSWSQKVSLIQIAWGQSRHADSFSTLASLLTKEVPRLIKVEVEKQPSIDVKMNVSNVRVSVPCWMDPIIDFFTEDRVPSNEKKAEGYAELLLGFGCLRITGCTRGLLGDLTCFAYILVKLTSS